MRQGFGGRARSETNGSSKQVAILFDHTRLISGGAASVRRKQTRRIDSGRFNAALRPSGSAPQRSISNTSEYCPTATVSVRNNSPRKRHQRRDTRACTC